MTHASLTTLLDGPFDPVISATVDRLVALHDRVCECHKAKEEQS
jgi:hypothetical protein